MAITISNLSNATSKRGFTFSDIHLDLQESQRSHNNRNDNVVAGNDILADTDEEAIKNSIRNILFQKRYLAPTFGANLRAYIGQPLSDMGAYAIGNIVDRNLNIFEPRIKVEKILVSPDYDNFTYIMVIIYSFRNFKTVPVVVNAAFSVGRGDFQFLQ